jgi:hypothetical protein
MAADWKAYPRRPKAKALGYQPQICGCSERPKAEALGYLEARARATAKSRSPSGMTNKKGNFNGNCKGRSLGITNRGTGNNNRNGNRRSFDFSTRKVRECFRSG